METRKHIKLLVVDEQLEYFQRIREFAELCAHQYKFECLFSPSEEEACANLKTWQPSVVLVDLHTEKISWEKLFEGCRASLIPVVATSLSPSKELAKNILDHGAAVYLPKSDDPEELEQLLQTVATVSVTSEVVH